MERLARVGAPVIGLVLNQAKRLGSGDYAYGYGYTYGRAYAKRPGGRSPLPVDAPAHYSTNGDTVHRGPRLPVVGEMAEKHIQ